MKRLEHVVLIGSFVGFSWLGMQAVHELGHVLGALLGGGTVNKVVLHPLTISRTDVSPNPHPLLEVWAGPVVGCLLPLAAYGLAAIGRSPGLYLFRFFAGFCLVANGAYIGGGIFERVADAGELLRYGASPWHLIAFGAATLPLGLYLWNGLGPAFGFGNARGRVSRSAALWSAALLLATCLVETLLSSRS